MEQMGVERSVTELRQIIEDSEMSEQDLRAFLKEVLGGRARSKRQYKPGIPAPPCTRFVTVQRVSQCKHCGAIHTSTVQLKEDDKVPYITKEGRVSIITSASPAVVHTCIGMCESCLPFVKTWEREELEKRYLTLLSKVILLVAGGKL